jgi:hypothetical protein
MGQASLKLRRTTTGWAHWCPACEETHVYQVGVQGHPNWTFDGNVDSPSFSPSMRIRWGNWGDDAPDDKAKYDGRICHYFLTAGKLSYCGDSTHALAGQTVDLPDLPAHLRDQ